MGSQDLADLAGRSTAGSSFYQCCAQCSNQTREDYRCNVLRREANSRAQGAVPVARNADHLQDMSQHAGRYESDRCQFELNYDPNLL